MGTIINKRHLFGSLWEWECFPFTFLLSFSFFLPLLDDDFSILAGPGAGDSWASSQGLAPHRAPRAWMLGQGGGWCDGKGGREVVREEHAGATLARMGAATAL